MKDLSWPPDFEPVQALSQGAHEEVWRGIWRGQDAVLRRTRSEGSMTAELEMMASLQHPQLAELLHHGTTGEHAFLIRRWIPGEPWSPASLAPSDPKPWEQFQSLCHALQALHGGGFVHGDLKPQNIIAGETESDPPTKPVLTDFGLARRSTLKASASTPGPVAGSTWYLAPECLLGSPPSVASDLFALGVMLFQCLGGELTDPAEFYGRFPAEEFLVAAGQPIESFPEWSRPLLASLLQRDPGARPSSAQAVALRLQTSAPGDWHTDPVPTPSAPLQWPRCAGMQQALDDRFGEGRLASVDHWELPTQNPPWAHGPGRRTQGLVPWNTLGLDRSGLRSPGFARGMASGPVGPTARAQRPPKAALGGGGP